MSRVATAVLTLGVVLLPFAGPAAAVDSFFDVFTEIPMVGVAPFAPLVEHVGHMSAGTFLHELDHNLVLTHGDAAGGGPLPFEVALHDPLPVGTPSTDSFFDITYRQDLAGGQPYPADSFFDVFVELDIPGAGPSHLVPLSGTPGSYFSVFIMDGFYIKDGFYITYRVEVGPGGGCHEMTMHFELADGFTPVNVQVVPSPNVDSFFDVFFEVHAQSGAVNFPSPVPMVHTTTTGEFLSAPVAVQPTTWGAVKSLYR